MFTSVTDVTTELSLESFRNSPVFSISNRLTLFTANLTVFSGPLVEKTGKERSPATIHDR